MKEKTRMDFTILFVSVAIIILADVCGWNDPKPAPVKYFTQGQILLPDYACNDTLIVRDAAGLNKAFAPIEQGITGHDYGDSDYDSLFHSYCLTFNQYKDELICTGYRADIANHLALVEFGMIKPDALYYSIIED